MIEASNKALTISEQCLLLGLPRSSYYYRSKGISVKRVRRIRKQLGLRTIYPTKNLSVPNVSDKKYPYLLRDLDISRVNQVWSSDITYIKVNGSFCYLVAIKDVYSRKILSWKLSNTLNASICVDTLNQAIEEYGKPEIFNTDQGSQYTSDAFI